VYLRLIFKSPQHYGKSRLKWTPLYKILNRKNHNHFKIGFLMLQLDFKKHFPKIQTTKNSNLIRFYLILKYCWYPNCVPWAFKGWKTIVEINMANDAWNCREKIDKIVEREGVASKVLIVYMKKLSHSWFIVFDR